MNGHIYATCAGNETEGGEDGLVEVDVAPGGELVLVKKHAEARGGQVSERNGSDFLSIASASHATLFTPASYPIHTHTPLHLLSGRSINGCGDDAPTTSKIAIRHHPFYIFISTDTDTHNNNNTPLPFYPFH